MLRVLTYHRVREPSETPELDPTLVSATPRTFRRQMCHVAKWYNPVTLTDVMEAFTGGPPLPARAVHITFDDAYRDFADVAWPILRELGIPVTLFVPTAYPADGTKRLWWDRVYRARSYPPPQASELAHPLMTRRLRTLLRELPHDDAELLVSRWCEARGESSAGGDRPMLDWNELRSLHAEGVAMGAHTEHHVSLTRVSERRVREELGGSLSALRREIGDVPAVIAYPYGMYAERVVRLAREEGFVLGFTCDDGLSRPGVVDPLCLRRTNITPRTTPSVFAARMLPWFGHVDRWRHRRARAELQR